MIKNFRGINDHPLAAFVFTIKHPQGVYYKPFPAVCAKLFFPVAQISSQNLLKIRAAEVAAKRIDLKRRVLQTQGFQRYGKHADHLNICGNVFLPQASKPKLPKLAKTAGL